VTEPAPSSSATALPDEVRARPVVSAAWCWGVAAAILAAFATIAAILKSSSDGVTFHSGDQIAIAGIGVAIAGLVSLFTRPRLIADRETVRIRGILGDYRVVPWNVVRSVDFRPKWRWARLVLAADETVSLYAVQRWDGARSVETMRRLRALHAAATTPRS
jgi:hypothetical protein